MINPPPFNANVQGTVNIVVAAATANVQVPNANISRSAFSALSLLNVGSAVTFVRLGNTNAVVATTSDIPIGPNERYIMMIPSGQDPQDVFVAAIGAVGPTLYITPGTIT